MIELSTKPKTDTEKSEEQQIVIPSNKEIDNRPAKLPKPVIPEISDE